MIRFFVIFSGVSENQRYCISFSHFDFPTENEYVRYCEKTLRLVPAALFSSSIDHFWGRYRRFLGLHLRRRYYGFSVCIFIFYVQIIHAIQFLGGDFNIQPVLTTYFCDIKPFFKYIRVLRERKRSLYLNLKINRDLRTLIFQRLFRTLYCAKLWHLLVFLWKFIRSIIFSVFLFWSGWNWSVTQNLTMTICK